MMSDAEGGGGVVRSGGGGGDGIVGAFGVVVVVGKLGQWWGQWRRGGVGGRSTGRRAHLSTTSDSVAADTEALRYP